MNSWTLSPHCLQRPFERSKPQRGLYLVSTPIGNGADITLRALYTLAYVDLIVCEDTRVSQKLLSLFEIKTPLLSYHEYNAEKQRPKILERLQNQETIALISDAGTPLISDPGYKLVQSCYDAQIPVTSVPGPASPIVALTLSALPPSPFTFGGFIPSKSSARCQFFNTFKSWTSTLVFFETGSRLVSSLKDLLACLGDRKMALARELTKKFEEVIRGNVKSLIQQQESKLPLKGEIVLVIEGCSPLKELSDEEIKEYLKESLEASLSLKDAVSHVAQTFSLSRRRVYKLGLELCR